MGDEHKTAASQWGFNDKPKQPKPEEPVDKEKDKKEKESPKEPEGDTDKEPKKPYREITYAELMRRRGFFESVSYIECPVKRMTALLEEFKQEAVVRIKEVTDSSEAHINYLNEQIAIGKARIDELKEKLKLADLYKEDEDEVLKKLIAEKDSQEKELATLRDRLTDVRIKLGEAKAGIIDRSLADAEAQVKKALGIQKTIYDDTYEMNRKKFEDEKDHLARLLKCYQALLVFYEERYRKINLHLSTLDVDGINPATSRILITVGNVSFAAAGFFFSTFAGATGFGNQGMLNFVLQGLIDTAQQQGSFYYKIAVLLGLIVLITLISIGCNYLLNRLKRKSEEEILSEVMLGGEASEEEENANFHAKVKSNNWYAFWLQLIPGVFIAGLLILSISLKAHPDSIGAINASSEGLIAGTSMAIALAGLIYLYIVKIVEPRLVKKYTANPGVHVNWGRANWELVVVIGIFLLFCICIIAIPYYPEREFNIIQVDHRTRFSILLFIGVALGGSIAFAYSVRSHGLIETSQLLEVIMIRLNDYIGRCSAPRAPSLHNGLTEEQGNVVQHVLKQLLFKASLNIANPSAQRVRVRPLTFFEKVAIALKLVDKPKVQDPPPVVPLLPWEEKYFPHLTDEVKAVEFEYRERKSKVQKAEDNIDDHKTARATEHRRYESDIEKCRKNIDEHHSQIRKTLQEKAEQCRQIKDTYHAVITDLQDGFHLGMYYRENGIGPRPGYYDYCAPNGQPAQPLLITSNK